MLERQTTRFLPEELEVYFDDIVDAAERIWDLLDNYKEVVEGLESTNESVISHRQNDILRVLTIFSVVLLPLTLITGIFGMNVDFPGFDTSDGLVGDRRRDGRRARRGARLLPLRSFWRRDRQLWAPWRLEYVAAADERDGCVFCLADAGDDEERLVVHRGERGFVLLNRFPYTSGHCWWCRAGTWASSATWTTRRPSSSTGSPGGHGRARETFRRRASTSAGTSAASPAPASSTTSTSTSCRAGRATRTSCRCSRT